MARRNVSASIVREWAASPEGSKSITDAGAPFPGSRGRLHPDTLVVFHSENKNMRYETASEAEKPTVTVPVKVLTKVGRATTVQKTVTTEAARALLGQEGRRGRFDKSLLSLALEAEALA